MSKFKLKVEDVCPENIWNYRQNHPELVVRDVKDYQNSQRPHTDFTGPALVSFVRKSLMARGINKWLANRRDIIAYKKEIKNRVKQMDKLICPLKLKMSKCYCSPRDIVSGKCSVYDYVEYTQARQEYLINKNVLKELRQVRSTLKSICMSERYKVWEGKKLADMNTITARDE